MRCAIPAGRARLRYGAALHRPPGHVGRYDGHVPFPRRASRPRPDAPLVQGAAPPAFNPLSARHRRPRRPADLMPAPANDNGGGDPRPARPWRWAASFWLAGTFVMLVRAGWLFAGAGRLLRGCRVIDDPRLTGTLDQLKRSMGIRRPVRLASGPAVRVPAVLGLFVPVVLLPLAALNEMPVTHFRIILAHELAHVRRHDYMVNLLQLMVERCCSSIRPSGGSAAKSGSSGKPVVTPGPSPSPAAGRTTCGRSPKWWRGWWGVSRAWG